MVDELMTASGLPPAHESNATLAMSMPEASLLLQQLLRSRSYVEWGSGGSTELVSHLILTQQLHRGFRAYSIESSTDWMKLMRARSHMIARAEATGQLQFIHGDMGPTGHLGFPKNRLSPEQAGADTDVYVPTEYAG